jgi:N-acetylglucosamine-6-phosphate deacetylase
MNGMTLPIQRQWLIISGGDVVLPAGEVLPCASVLIQDGLIQDVVKTLPDWVKDPSVSIKTIDATGCWVTPGLIDQHINGGFGVDFNLSSLEEIRRLLQELARCGVTAIQPTIITAPRYEMISALSTIDEISSVQQPGLTRLLGTHLEGPFINPQFKGAHPAEHIRPATLDNLEGLISPSVKRFTIAPELPNALNLIQSLTQKGYLCSLGHTGANFEEAQLSYKAGASCITHLYNAMGKLHHRESSLLLSALLSPDIFAELIVDGYHLSREILMLTLKVKSWDKLILVSDSNGLAGLKQGSSVQFAHQSIHLGHAGPVNAEGTLAGSATLLSSAVRQMVDWDLLPFEQAVQMATYNPAAHLGELDHFGQLKAGAVADVVLWRKASLDITQVVLAGELLQSGVL